MHRKRGGAVCSRCGALRKKDGQVGAEERPDCMGWATGEWCGECYVCNLAMRCGDEWLRVLRDDGTLWLNVGDASVAYKGQHYNVTGLRGTGEATNVPAAHYMATPQTTGLATLNLLSLPWRLGMAFQARGWVLRSSIIWAKITYLPESVEGWRWEQHKIGRKANRRDCPGCEKCNPNGGLVLRRGSWRPTRAHEYILLFSKQGKYYMDNLAVRQLPAAASLERIRRPAFWLEQAGEKDLIHGDPDTHRSSRKALENFARNPGRNLNDVWVIPPKPLKEKHLAPFPPGLPELCIRAGTSEKGCCPHCGKPWARVIERPDVPDNVTNPERGRAGLKNGKWVGYIDKESAGHRLQRNVADGRSKGLPHNNPWTGVQTVGWKQTCACPEHDPVPCTVLDPFSGSGTTALVANGLGRDCIGVDFNADYIEIAKTRIAQNELTFKPIIEKDPSEIGDGPAQLSLL